MLKTNSIGRALLLRAALTAVALVTAALALQARDYVPQDYVWTSQSANSAGSMPCGGHDVGMNVWVENGDIMVYIAKSGMFDENNSLLKAGRLRLRLEPNPFEPGTEGFTQTLCLDDGAVYIRQGGTEVRLWADVFTPVVFIEINAGDKVDAVLGYENWRYDDRPLTKAECQQCSYKWVIPADCRTLKDSIEAADGRLTFTHKNNAETVFDFTVTRESLDSIKDELPDPIGGLAFGGVITAPDFTYTGTIDGVYASTDYRAWCFEARRVRRSVISVSLFCGDERPENITSQASRRRSKEWWHAYWQRSYIKIESDDARAATMVRNYELARYMLGCNAYGAWPTKFNGGLFTFDPVYVDEKRPFTPDYRCWGGGTMTAQNQRLIYWPMLKSGDTDMMIAQFDTYLRMLPAAMARTRYYWGHAGASFTEQIENFGLPNPAEYGKHKPGDDLGTERNAWLEYQWDTALEFCSMMLLSHSYASTDISRYEKLIGECVTFFDEHYQYLARKSGIKALNGEGKLILYPSSGCETYKMAYNASSLVAALHAVVAQCEAYDKARGSIQADTLVDGAPLLIDYGIKDRLPEIPLTVIDGDTCIAPAVVWARVQNVETPQLYPVFPWRVYGLGRPSLNIARNTYTKDPHAIAMRSTTGWKQDNIWAACLGLTDEAMALNTEKLSNGPYRFTAFYDMGFDWAPDCNRAGAAMIGLQEMLLQEAPDGSLLLFPAWDKSIDASFRLHASGNRTVEARIKDGKIEVISEKNDR